MDEFAQGYSNTSSYFAPVLHSSHIDDIKSFSKEDFRIAGGSSGGSAVSVAIGAAEVALGSDTGGSTRIPAAYNGVVGFKPSYGRLSRHGLVPLGNAFDTPSIFTRTVEHCIKYYEMMKGHDFSDSTCFDIEDPTDKKLAKPQDKEGRNQITIGVPKEYQNKLLSKECEAVWNFAIDAIKGQGIRIRDVSLPHTAYSIICYYILVDSDVASNMSRYDGIRYGHQAQLKTDSFNEMLATSRTEALNTNVRRRIFAGNFYNITENRGRYYEQAAKVRRLLKQDFDSAFSIVDALLTPTTGHSAPKFSEIKSTDLETQLRDDFFTQPANLCGLPAISIPFGSCSAGFPLGVQIISPFGYDNLCLEIAKQLEPFSHLKYK